MPVCNCFLQAPPLSRFLLPVLSRRAPTLSAGYGLLKSTVMFSSAVNRTKPLTSPVKRVSRKDDEVASASDLQFETPLKIVEYPDPIIRANKRIGVFDENLKNLVDAMYKKISDLTKIFHAKAFSQISFELYQHGSVIASNDQIIDVDKHA